MTRSSNPMRISLWPVISGEVTAKVGFASGSTGNVAVPDAAPGNTIHNRVAVEMDWLFGTASGTASHGICPWAAVRVRFERDDAAARLGQGRNG